MSHYFSAVGATSYRKLNAGKLCAFVCRLEGNNPPKDAAAVVIWNEAAFLGIQRARRGKVSFACNALIFARDLYLRKGYSFEWLAFDRRSPFTSVRDTAGGVMKPKELAPLAFAVSLR